MIIEILNDLGVTRRAIAKEEGVHEDYLSQIFRGHFKSTKHEKALSRFCRKLANRLSKLDPSSPHTVLLLKNQGIPVSHQAKAIGVTQQRLAQVVATRARFPDTWDYENYLRSVISKLRQIR